MSSASVTILNEHINSGPILLSSLVSHFRGMSDQLSAQGLDPLISDICIDSRAVRDGSLFVALPGEKLDGRDYIEQAIENGASAILSTHGLAAMPIASLGVENPREILALLAAKFYGGQPQTMVAITGTNGKSSTVEFLRQIWAKAGIKGACFGTLGIKIDAGLVPLSHTTPDAISLHKTLSEMANSGITHAAMEASSHGLVQSRLDGVNLSAVAFTNLSQDHFDYHSDMEDYFRAKARLVDVLAVRARINQDKPLPAVINVDGEYGLKMAGLAVKNGLDVMRVGWSGDDIRIVEITPRHASQSVDLMIGGKRHRAELPLMGEFQILNAVSALGLAIKTGVRPETALAALSDLTGVAGRMELIGKTKSGAPVIVDFAHTPDGLEKLLRGIRPHTQGRIVVVFGCGGDRDPSKRPQMGSIAKTYADMAIVTDDNPRSETPATIRAAILAANPEAIEIGDRAKAIAYGIDALNDQDCLVIAGKGHENGQIVGGKVLPFNDGDVVRSLLQAKSDLQIKRGAK